MPLPAARRPPFWRIGAVPWRPVGPAFVSDGISSRLRACAWWLDCGCRPALGEGSPGFADAEHVAVGVTDVELADTPWLVCRGMGYVEALSDTAVVEQVKVVDPDRHPGPL